MHLIRNIVCCVFLWIFVQCCAFCVFANEDIKYIVYPNKNMVFLQSESSQDFLIVDKVALDSLLESGAVDWYEEDYEVFLLENDQTYEDTLLPNKWDLTMIDAHSAWTVDCYGEGITIGVIDSGTVNHPDIKNNILTGYNYISNSIDVEDNIGHGTFVNGIISAEINDIGIVGVAPKARVLPLKCFDVGYKTTVSTISKAIKDAVDKYDCDIINMSLGLTQYSETLENAINYAVDKGCIIVASVGNTGSENLYYPAAFDNVIGVGAVDSNATVTDFSQKNESVFVVAPGQSIISTNMNGSYSEKKGTSFSAPMVSGLIALLLDMDKDLSLETIMSILSQSVADGGESGYDTSYGYGIINVKSSIDSLISGVQIFITSIDDESDVVDLNILNTTETLFKGYFILVCYDDGVMSEYNITCVEILPSDNILLPDTQLPPIFKCFLWKSIVDISTISNVIERTE